MKIWVDADACPRGIKDILCRVADRAQVTVIFVANQWLRLPKSEFIQLIQVEQGDDVADNKIADDCVEGDLVITADIILADRVIKKMAKALDPRGKIYDKNNIGQILNVRDFMDSLRGSGVETGGQRSFGNKEKQKFANELDRIVARRFN